MYVLLGRGVSEGTQDKLTEVTDSGGTLAELIAALDEAGCPEPLSVTVDGDSGRPLFACEWPSCDGASLDAAPFGCVLGAVTCDGCDIAYEGERIPEQGQTVAITATMPTDNLARALAALAANPPRTGTHHPLVDPRDTARMNLSGALAGAGFRVGDDERGQEAVMGEWVHTALVAAATCAAADGARPRQEGDGMAVGVTDADVEDLFEATRDRLMSWATYGGTLADTVLRGNVTSQAMAVSAEWLSGIGGTATLAYAVGVLDALWNASRPGRDGR